MASFDDLKTHLDFRTVVPNVQSACDMDDHVGTALVYQYMFEKRTTPWEMQHWDHDELQKFEIDLEEIDRLYYIYHYDDNVSGQEFKMAARMNYKGQKLYVEMTANCDFTGFDCQGGGFIFVSSDANVFMKVVLTSDFEADLIYQSLAEDGIDAEEQTEYDKCSRMFWKNPPMLKYLCHQTVYDYKDDLEVHSSKLPTILRDSVDDFIRTKDAKRYYDEDEL